MVSQNNKTGYNTNDCSIFNKEDELVILFDQHLLIKKMNTMAAVSLGKISKHDKAFIKSSPPIINDFLDILKLIDQFRSSNSTYQENFVQLNCADNQNQNFHLRLYKTLNKHEREILVFLKTL